ncbi:hypothetical protein CS0771_20830 [Catellatospora sp. IY07-71]|uniref:hypothetical protein n=1 Tax=Catellatospora sp. IY07-71 TaxID=2728827 RepID=UPI001BB397E1|nr:hypothetical protein [Catellatospora sp. IY07-71]BCJ72539.1 hypothetical protein CS0771_20830 [Catellatospora sp. IY07-71]
MRVSEVPMPAVIAARPRDGRGYPVPAITPWEGGEPRFASTGTARTYICAVERRCSVCGTVMAPGPVWRVVAAAEAEAIGAALAAGVPYRNQAATVEAPGHRTCMLYAAVTCPYLAFATARRGAAALTPTLAAERGERRQEGGAVVGFDAYEFRLQGDVVLFRFGGVHEFLPHREGAEQLAALREALAAEDGTAPSVVDYLGTDEDSAERRCRELLG